MSVRISNFQLKWVELSQCWIRVVDVPRNSTGLFWSTGFVVVACPSLSPFSAAGLSSFPPLHLLSQSFNIMCCWWWMGAGNGNLSLFNAEALGAHVLFRRLFLLFRLLQLLSILKNITQYGRKAFCSVSLKWQSWEGKEKVYVRLSVVPWKLLREMCAS